MGQNEAFSRVLIDKALDSSGWDLLDPLQVRFEQRAKGDRADYVLMDKLGRASCVLEAKKTGLDPYDAKEQARGYAENLKAPFVLLSNGEEHWFWNLERADEKDAYRIERLPSPDDLQRMRLRNLQPPRPLRTELVGRDYLSDVQPESSSAGIRSGRWMRSPGSSTSRESGSSCWRWRRGPGKRCNARR